MDVFTGQMTTEVRSFREANHTCLVNVPPNMTKYYQPLDLTVNGFAKRFMKAKFSEWYSRQIGKQLREGIELQDIIVPLRLSLLKPLHAGWLVELYNEMTSHKGKEIIASGWRASGISDALKLGTAGIQSIDPFHDLDPLMSQEQAQQETHLLCNIPEEERVLIFRGLQQKTWIQIHTGKTRTSMG